MQHAPADQDPFTPRRNMSITKLKWQWQSWQSSNPDPTNLNPDSNPHAQYGRVITGMLTGGGDPQPQPDHQTTTRSSGR
jgi:hypothetical protein